MRTIEIKEVKTEAGEELDYLELCSACLKAPAQGGYTADMMETRLKALSEFPSVARKPGEPKAPPPVKEVTVTEDVFLELLKCVNEFRWGVLDQVFVDFVRYIQGLKDVKPKADKADKK